jgi:hypothetical protein
VCVPCVKYSLLSKKSPTPCNSDAFITGFHNWKKATEKFRIHEKSGFHTGAVLSTNSVVHGVNLVVKLTAGKQRQQQSATNALKILFNALLFLARQGLPIRGKVDMKSNYINLFNLLATYNSDLATFLARKKTYISHVIQNEMLELCANSLLRNIATEARAHLESLSMVVRTTILSKFQFAYDMLLTIFRYTKNLLGFILQQKVMLQHYLVLLWMFCCESIWTFHMLSGKLTMVQVQCLVNMPGCKH